MSHTPAQLQSLSEKNNVTHPVSRNQKTTRVLFYSDDNTFIKEIIAASVHSETIFNVGIAFGNAAEAANKNKTVRFQLPVDTFKSDLSSWSISFHDGSSR